MTTKFYEPDRNICSHCVLLIGSENAERSITLGGSITPDTAKYVAEGIAEIQPYKYLIETGRLKITYAHTSFDRFVDVESYASNSREYLKTDSQKELIDHYSLFCNLDILVFFTSKASNAYYGGNGFIGVNPFYKNSLKIPVSVHELGHAFGLGDEYFYPNRLLRFGSEDIQLKGHNMDYGVCPKWNKRIDELNCRYIYGRFGEDLVKDFVKISTGISVMRKPERDSRYNIISCEAILNEFGVDGALEMCKQWACEGEVVKQSTTIC
jgi:hypothetical protein